MMYTMAFDVDEAWNQLSEKGYVYTLRPTTFRGKAVKPSEGSRLVTRNGKSTGIVVEKRFKLLIKNRDTLANFQSAIEGSGFRSVDEWVGHASGDGPWYLFLCMGEDVKLDDPLRDLRVINDG